MNITDIFNTNYDVYRNILHSVGQGSGLPRVNTLLYRLARYTHEQDECPKLTGLLAMLTESGISDSHDILQDFFLRIRERIATLAHGADAALIDRGFADRMKRTIAVLLSRELVGVLPLPQKKAFAYEVHAAALAYATLKSYFGGEDEVRAVTVIDAFRPIPRHYLKHLFRFFETISYLCDGLRPEIYSQKIVDLLSGIHRMLCEQGEMRIARRMYSKAYSLLCTWNTTGVYSTLSYMLAQQGDYDDALHMLEDHLPPDQRRLYLEKLVIIASQNGDFDRALLFLRDLEEGVGGDIITGRILIQLICRTAIARGQLDYALYLIERLVDDDVKENLYLGCVGQATSSGEYDRAMDITMYLPGRFLRETCYHNIMLHAARSATTKENVVKLLTKIDIFRRSRIVKTVIHTVDVSDDNGREIALYYAEKSPVSEENRQMLWEALLKRFIKENVHVDLIYDVWRHIPWTYAARCVQLITKRLAKKGDFASAMYFLEVSCPQNTVEIIKGFVQRACRHKRPNLDEAMSIFLERYGDVLFAIETFGRSNVALYYAKKGDVAKAVEIANDELSTLLEITGTIARRDFIEAMSFIHSHFHSHLKDQCSNMSFEVDGIPCALGDVIAHVLVQGFMHQGNRYFAQKVAYRIESERMKQEALQKIVQDNNTSFFNPEFPYKEREIDALLNSWFSF